MGLRPLSLSAYLQSQLPIQPESSGRITLNPAIALRKLRESQTADPYTYVLGVVAAAVAAGASEIQATTRAAPLN